MQGDQSRSNGLHPEAGDFDPSELQPIHAVLSSWTLADYLRTKPPSQVVTLSSSMTIGQVLKVLATSNILSAPLFSRSGSQFLGFVDMGDLLGHLLRDINIRELTEANQAFMLRSAGVRLDSETVSSALSSNDGALIYTAQQQTCLLEVVRRGFVQQAPGGRRACHRVAVFDLEEGGAVSEEGGTVSEDEAPSCPDGRGIRITHVVSQSDVLSFLLKRVPAMGPAMGRTLEALGLAYKPVVCVPAEMSTIHAFATMQAERVSSVGVISHAHAGALVANLSVSDLRGLLPQHLSALALPVLQFIADKASTGSWPAARHLPSNEWALRGAEVLKEPQPTTCTPQSTLGQVMELMMSSRVHRVYVVDAVTGRARGIVTATDVLELLAGGQAESEPTELA